MALQLPIYMDYHATTPLDPRVLEAMLLYLRNEFGNAASRNHKFGWTAEAAVEKARDQVAALIHASPKEIVWTSGATEGNNLAIKGVAEYYRSKGRHIIVAGGEIPPSLRDLGYQVTHFDAGTPLSKIREAIRYETQNDDTIVVKLSGFAAGKELSELALFCRERGILFDSESGDVVKLAADANKGKGRHIITSATEHKATLDTTKRLAHEGYDVTVLPVDHEGHVHPAEVEKAIRRGTARD